MCADYRKAADLVSALFDGMMNKEMNQSMSFIRGWKSVVGDKLAAHSKIIDLDRGSIIVEVDHPGWSQQILLQKKRIVSSLSRSFPELQIQNIQIRVLSECSAPYVKEATPIGEGLHRNSEEETDVSVNAELPDELQDLFSKLKESIRKGKPKS